MANQIECVPGATLKLDGQWLQDDTGLPVDASSHMLQAFIRHAGGETVITATLTNAAEGRFSIHAAADVMAMVMKSKATLHLKATAANGDVDSLIDGLPLIRRAKS